MTSTAMTTEQETKEEQIARVRAETEEYQKEHDGKPFFGLRDDKDESIVEVIGGWGKVVLVKNKFYDPIDPKSKPTTTS